MAQQQFLLSVWIAKLTTCLQELISYERWLESELRYLRHRGEMLLKLPGNARRGSNDCIRERVLRYSLLAGRQRYSNSGYQQNISQKLSTLLDVLLEHPTMKAAAYTLARLYA